MRARLFAPYRAVRFETSRAWRLARFLLRRSVPSGPPAGRVKVQGSRSLNVNAIVFVLDREIAETALSSADSCRSLAVHTVRAGAFS